MSAIFLLDKSTAAMTTFMKAFLAQKNKNKSFRYNYLKITEHFTSSLFNDSLFADADSDNSENSAYNADIINVDSKKDVEYFIKKHKEKEIVSDIVSQGKNNVVVYMFTLKTKELLAALSSAEKMLAKNGNNVFIVNTLDNKRAQKSVVIDSLSALGVKKTRASKIYSFMSGDKGSYENLIPLISECLYDRSFAKTLSEAEEVELVKILDVRKVKEKQAVKPPWEWTECFAKSDFKGFTQSLMYFQSNYSTFYLYKRMREDLGAFHTRSLAVKNQKTKVGNTLITTACIANMRTIADRYYQDLLDSKNNADRTFSELTVALWDEFSKNERRVAV